MRHNESTAVSTTRVLLVPYDGRHVPTYHTWMEDPAIQEATASEPLTLEEEHENQESWRASHDKLTFIVCEPLPTSTTTTTSSSKDTPVQAGEADSPERMVGDINLFLYPYEDEGEDDEDEYDDDGAHPTGTPTFCVGEVDIMIAGQQHRGKGLGRAAVRAFLHYLGRNVGRIMREYAADKDMMPDAAPGLKLLMAKINRGNEGSLALFRSLGFEQEGEVNYFGEVKLVFRRLDTLAAEEPEGYAELVYSREQSQDGKQQHEEQQ
ncbi:GNAT domain-containing protein [Chaetomium fimeti]|uniref:GNAT domain-containing protein n=1 Tax=Chaetomium fimeti TaxID=1854472 RepID=A0AAE0HI38_9PEZI|nr:GNAT domain-containing protein [Chaetomium fimeti]